ncbi:stage II sporulation protein M [Priestia endophytica]|uniref:stage II sporulation protein M n=1 Tax=Priestia endophytica TaxID=135735 RepID=UPI00227FCFFF|nr:stage II sporulation protein M [Priestia endophytica]MCY8232824.1 stage II sporulation protein M [Priestia endophytica]
MNKQRVQELLFYHIQKHSSVYLFVTVLFFIGVVFGAVVVNSLNLGQKEDLFYYLDRFFGQVTKGEVANSADILKQSFWHNIKYLGFIWILGISVIGLPVVLVLLFLKGIVIGFTVGFLVNQMGFHGFLLSFVSVLPQNLFLIPLFLVVSTLSLSFSLKLMKQFVRSGSETMIAAFMRYSTVILLILAVVTISSTLEAYASPFLMKTTLSFLE